MLLVILTTSVECLAKNDTRINTINKHIRLFTNPIFVIGGIYAAKKVQSLLEKMKINCKKRLIVYTNSI